SAKVHEDISFSCAAGAIDHFSGASRRRKAIFVNLRASWRLGGEAESATLARTRMSAFVDLQQMRLIDFGVALGRRERGVAEEFLDGAQVAAGAEQMGGEGVAQGMRRGAFGQAQGAAHGLHQALDNTRVQTLAAGAAEDGLDAQ